ncbi:MAG: Rieske (2Fe-2S) protein, partial [Gammaproteobacteria bacterium]
PSTLRTPLFAASPDDLAEGAYRRVRVRHEGEETNVVVFRHGGEIRAYLNRCVHMPRELDCERATIFDESGERLRCSMHGIVYDPVSGEAQSEICAGLRLTAVRFVERDDGVWIRDKRIGHPAD